MSKRTGRRRRRGGHVVDQLLEQLLELPEVITVRCEVCGAAQLVPALELEAFAAAHPGGRGLCACSAVAS